MPIIKQPKREFKKSNGLTLPQYFRLEKACLEILNTNYKCKCARKRNHFPAILKCDIKKCIFELSDQGISIDTMIQERKKVRITDLDEQLDCILDNLKRNKIRHLDIHDSGKNMCIDKFGNISLIDFDVASIGNNYMSETLKERSNKYGNYDQYLVKAKSKMLRMTKKVIA